MQAKRHRREEHQEEEFPAIPRPRYKSIEDELEEIEELLEEVED